MPASREFVVRLVMVLLEMDQPVAVADAAVAVCIPLTKLNVVSADVPNEDRF
jgi:hypothetical protein